ncbi:hypothetical protein AGMMS49944_20770 [Spirochaetia bacterium]|nr:hypothetical protein AGMMS49944_20770 [Spirochaetia bacterium]
MGVNELIREKINKAFPNLVISIYPDETENNTIVAIDDEFYYSDEYQALVFDLKMNYLWKQEIFNYLFVNEKHDDTFITIPLVRSISSNSVLLFNATPVDTPLLRNIQTNYSESKDEICLIAA